MIEYDDFSKIELKIAKILEAEAIENSEKLVRLQIDLGGETRQLVAGIKKAYSPESLVGKQIIVVSNLAPRNIMGNKSEAMLLAARDKEGLPVLLTPEREVEPGTSVN